MTLKPYDFMLFNDASLTVIGDDTRRSPITAIAAQSGTNQSHLSHGHIVFYRTNHNQEASPLLLVFRSSMKMINWFSESLKLPTSFKAIDREHATLSIESKESNHVKYHVK